jgi:hypothetical protein
VFLKVVWLSMIWQLLAVTTTVLVDDVIFGSIPGYLYRFVPLMKLPPW